MEYQRYFTGKGASSCMCIHRRGSTKCYISLLRMHLSAKLDFILSIAALQSTMDFNNTGYCKCLAFSYAVLSHNE